MLRCSDAPSLSFYLMQSAQTSRMVAQVVKIAQEASPSACWGQTHRLRFSQTGAPTLSLRGSGWASLALSRRLALGATTSSFPKQQAHEQPFVGLFCFIR